MPYPSYAKMTEEDMQALYAYLMQGVTPVQAANQPSEMGFPFNQRWGLALWNWLFLDDTPFQPQPAERRMEPRRLPGAGPGPLRRLPHAARHRLPGKDHDQRRPEGQAVPGRETVEGWRALSLRDLWTPQDTAEMLKTGRNRHGTVSGNMVDVVQHSTQYMSDGTCWPSAPTSSPCRPANDLPMQVAQGPAPVIAPAARGAEALATAAAHWSAGRPLRTRGGLGYLQFCADCHRSDGAAWTACSRRWPATARCSQTTPTLIHIMLTGWTARHPGPQPPADHAGLRQPERPEIAEILNFTCRRAGAARMRPRSRPGCAIAAQARWTPRAKQRPFETPRLPACWTRRMPSSWSTARA
jgi:thiosulfate dehydrogenase